MIPQGQYRLCGLWIYSPLILKGESKLFPLIGFDSSYFNLNRIFELKLTQKFPFRLVPSTQELLRPPVTTIITNMTNAFIVSVLQTGDGKIFAELRVNDAFEVKISLL